MKDSDADEPQAPLKRQKRRATRTDRILAACGLLLAGASAFFPWYVFFNPDKFGFQVANGDRTRDLPEWPDRNVFSVSPLAMVNRNTPEPKTTIPDPLTTATVSSIGKDDLKGQAAEDQPFPGNSGFRLLHVANGRALIEDTSGMYMVHIGSILPDNSRLAKIEQQNGKWVIVTSSGQQYASDGTGKASGK